MIIHSISSGKTSQIMDSTSRYPAVFLLFSLLAIAPPLSVAQPSPSDQFQDFCTGFTQSGPPIPTDLPQQFSLQVEANILNENRTVNVHEFYDGVNDRGSVLFVRNGRRERIVFNFASDEIYILTDNPGEDTDCTIFPLSESRFTNFTFGARVVNGTVHIGSPRTFLEGFRDADTPTQYHGLTDPLVGPRGIPAEQWGACFSSENSSFLAEYFFSVGWNFSTIDSPDKFDQVLVQIWLYGNSVFNNTFRNFTHVYSIYGFNSGPSSVPDRAFMVPTGTVCRGRAPGIPVPQVPSFFSTYIQFVDSRNATQVFTAREYYDYTHNLFRVDAYYDGSMGGDAGPYRLIHDFDGQLQYVINRHTSVCNISNLNNSFFSDVEFDENNSPRLVSPARFFLLNDFNYTYEGISVVRGVKVDSWIARSNYMEFNNYSNLTNGIFEVFFTRPEYIVRTDRSAGGSSIPWRVIIRGELATPADPPTNVTFEVDFFDFSPNEPPYDVFDVSRCSDPDDTHTVIFFFEVQREGVDFREFRTNLRQSLVNATGLRPLQINDIHIITNNETHIFVSLHFTNISELAQFGDGESIVTADQALNFLRASAPAGSPLPFQVAVSNGTMVAPVLFSSNRGRTPMCEACNDTCDNTCPTSPSSGGTTSNSDGTTSNSDGTTTNSGGTTSNSDGTTTNSGGGNTCNCPATGNTQPTTFTGPRNTSPPASQTTAPPGGCDDNITNRLKLSDGVVAGIGIGLFFAGFILALILLCTCFICIRCAKGGTTSVSSVKYKKHNDELETYS